MELHPPPIDTFMTPALDRLILTMKQTAKKRALFSKKELAGGMEGLLLSSLALLPFLHKTGATHLLDVGGGNGLPGLVIAAVRPDIRVTVAEGSEKAVATAHHLAKTANLGNATCALNPFGPSFTPPDADFLTSRATALFCSTWNILGLPSHWAFYGAKAIGEFSYPILAQNRSIGIIKSGIFLQKPDITYTKTDRKPAF